MKVIYFDKACACGGDKTELFLDAAKEAGVKLESFKIVKSISEQVESNISEVPTLMIDGNIIISGYQPSKKELKKLFKKYSK